MFEKLVFPIMLICGFNTFFMDFFAISEFFCTFAYDKLHLSSCEEIPLHWVCILFAEQDRAEKAAYIATEPHGGCAKKNKKERK